MNERIRELAEQAGFGLHRDGEIYTSRLEHLPITEDIEKFAQLIVRECMALMNQEQEYYSKPFPYEPSEYYERCRAKVDAFEDAASIIKNHFGVEE